MSIRQPRLPVSDHGAEFTSAIPAWSDETGMPWRIIAPVKLIQNGPCEAFNSNMRDELEEVAVMVVYGLYLAAVDRHAIAPILRGPLGHSTDWMGWAELP